MEIVIDKYSGFCPGVTNAISNAESHLDIDGKLYCLGDIVHNTVEVSRLIDLGLKIINYQEFKTLRHAKVLIRAHGEPPETYQIAKNNNIELIDATCSVVIRLQKKIKKIADEKIEDSTIIIFGKKGHAEVNGLIGQAGTKAMVVSDENDLDSIDFGNKLYVFSQTTRSPEKFELLVKEIEKRSSEANGGTSKLFTTYSICPLVKKREPLLLEFSKKYDVIIFVSDSKSSNGKMLFDICTIYNKNCHFISSVEDLKPEWFKKVNTVGVCGATSTPRWLMSEVAKNISDLD